MTGLCSWYNKDINLTKVFTQTLLPTAFTQQQEYTMPLESTAIQSFEQHHLDEPALKLRIEKLYDTSPEFASGNAATAFFEKAFAKGDRLYLGMFNDKPIAAIGCFNEGIEGSCLLQYLVVHPANRGRGIAAKFVKQVTDIERKKGNTRFVPGCAAIHRILVMYELI